MDNSLTKNTDIEKITARFIDEFLRVHPQRELPAWFKEKTSHRTMDKCDSWQLAIVASKKNKEIKNPNVIIDDVSGEKKHVIADSYQEIILFAMSFKKSDLSGEVILDIDFSQLNGDDLVSKV